nr:reverse transcriptase domain-containing protein [Tanacetum cinerariifolium]
MGKVVVVRGCYAVAKQGGRVADLGVCVGDDDDDRGLTRVWWVSSGSDGVEMVMEVMMMTRWGWWCAAVGGGDGDGAPDVVVVAWWTSRWWCWPEVRWPDSGDSARKTYRVCVCTYIAKVTRKLDKNGHENENSTQEPGIIKKSQPWSTLCMRTRNSYFPNNSSATIPRRQNKRRTPNKVEPELRTIVEMADNRTMEELLQAPTEGYGEAIVIQKINADHFEIKTNLLQLVQANTYHGFERENPHVHINNFKRITLTFKFRVVPNDVIKLMMFLYSLEGNARVWYDKEPPNSILTWEDLVNKFMNQFFPPSKITHLKNEISRFTQRFEEIFGEAWERFKEMLRAYPYHEFIELAQIDTFYNGLNDNDQDSLNAAAGGNLLSKTTREALQILKNKSKVHYSRNKPNVSRMNTTSRENTSKLDDRIEKLVDQISTLVDIFAKKIVTPAPVKAVKKSCVTCGGNHAYYNCPNTDSNQPSVCVAAGTYNQVAPQNRASNFMAPPGFALLQNSQNSNTIANPKGDMKAITTRSGVAYEGPSIPTTKKVVERETEETTDKEKTNFQGSTAHIQPPVTPILEPDVQKTLPKPNIPYPSRLNDQKLHEKDTNQLENSLTNKDKLFELAKILLNENCSAMLLKKLLDKLGDPGKFLFPCDFPGMDVRHALADLDRSITRPKGVAEDVFAKVGKFHFLIDFVVVDFEADPRVLLILGRSFLRTGRALIDLYGEEITLWVNDEAVTFNLSQTTRYFSTYDDLSVNRIDIIDVAREEFAQEILGFSSNSLGGNPTLTFEPILSDSSSSLTPFEGSDFILEEIDAYLKDEYVLSEINHADYDPKGDICLIEKLLNNDPFRLPPIDIKQGEVVKTKYLIEEPSELELKVLPFHLEYAYLECVDKLPVIISKDLKDDEKEALLKVIKSHKREIAWKITDIKGVRSFLGHAGFYRRFIQDFSKIARPMTHLLEKETPFVFSKDCIDAFETLKKKLTEAPILVVPDWKLPFELMCDASDFAIGVLPIELEHKAYWALKHVNFDLKTAGDHWKLQLNELHDQAYENSLIYKEKRKKIHDSKIKNRIFNVGDRVLLFNSRLKIFSRKLKTHWSGPFTITEVFPYGTIELSQPDGPNFKVNGHRVKHYFGGDVPQLVLPDL